MTLVNRDKDQTRQSDCAWQAVRLLHLRNCSHG